MTHTGSNAKQKHLMFTIHKEQTTITKSQGKALKQLFVFVGACKILLVVVLRWLDTISSSIAKLVHIVGRGRSKCREIGKTCCVPVCFHIEIPHYNIPAPVPADFAVFSAPVPTQTFPAQSWQPSAQSVKTQTFRCVCRTHRCCEDRGSYSSQQSNCCL